MYNKGRIDCEYKVTLRYRGLTMEELSKLLKLLDEGKLSTSSGYDDLIDLNVGKDYDRDCDGWEEPTGTYNFTLDVDQCGGISESSWKNGYSDEVLDGFDVAESLRQFIKDETGIE